MSGSVTGFIRNNVVGFVALFIALGAGAYAAGLPKDSVKAKQIKAGAVGNAELGPDAITTDKVADGSLLSADFKAGQLPQGPQGEQGPQGIPGPEGPATGPAGGHLAGSYPNPTIATGAVGPLELGSVVIKRVEQDIPDNNAGVSVDVQCDPGQQVIGGGGGLNSFVADVPIISSRPARSDGSSPFTGDGITGWRVSVVNPVGGTGTVTLRIFAICLV